MFRYYAINYNYKYNLSEVSIPSKKKREKYLSVKSRFRFIKSMFTLFSFNLSLLPIEESFDRSIS